MKYYCDDRNQDAPQHHDTAELTHVQFNCHVHACANQLHVHARSSAANAYAAYRHLRLRNAALSGVTCVARAIERVYVLRKLAHVLAVKFE